MENTPENRDLLLRELAILLGEPDLFSSPQWYDGFHGWVLNTGNKLFIFGTEASFNRKGIFMDRFSLEEKRFLTPGIDAFICTGPEIRDFTFDEKFEVLRLVLDAVGNRCSRKWGVKVRPSVYLVEDGQE